MQNRLSLFIIFAIILGSQLLYGQEKSGLETQADKFHKIYKFDDAISLYKQIIEQTPDSLYKNNIEKKIILSENGKALLEFASSPTVVASGKFNTSNFFLRYPGIPDKSLVSLPKELAEGDISTTKQGNFPILYYPSGSKKLIYSAPDNTGSWNLYTTQKLNDTLWSTPVLLNDNITSIGNELFPFLSSNGKELYFSSNGHYGMGGYDLYVSYWDDELNDWGVAQNMGFPYSSVGNDFFFYNTPDGLFSLFASNRDTQGEEINVYAITFDSTPLKKGISAEEAEKISHLLTSNTGEKTDITNEPPKEESKYTLAVKEVRRLQQEIKQSLKTQQDSRTLYNTLQNADDQALLAKKIAELETQVITLQQSLNTASVSLQQIEMEFLSKGIIITEEPTEQENNPDEAIPEFRFVNNSLGETPILNVQPAEPKIDLSFKILDQAVIADIDGFPSNGLVYQIQLFVVSNKPSLKALKGLSPVFERKTPTGKYLYTAGIFYAYDEALKNINKVKKLGFPTALITAYNNGKSLPLKSARLLEQKEKDSVIYQIVIEGYDTLPAETLKAIRDNTDKDIAKSTEGGAAKYVIGPFSKNGEAETLKDKLLNSGTNGVTVEKVAKN